MRAIAPRWSFARVAYLLCFVCVCVCASTAQQEAERAKFIVEKALQDKRSIVIRAEGDAESARMISEAVQSNPYYLELKTIEAARDIAGSLANSQNKVYLSSDMLMFNLLSSISGYA